VTSETSAGCLTIATLMNYKPNTQKVTAKMAEKEQSSVSGDMYYKWQHLIILIYLVITLVYAI
jgi:hypothetical protein